MFEIGSNITPKLGTGIFTIPDISIILRLPRYKVRRWIKQYWNKRLPHNNFNYTWGNGSELATDFKVLIEFYVFYRLRDEGISAQKVILAHKIISEDLKNPYPFATAEILTDGRRIFYNDTEKKDYIQADHTKQLHIEKILNEFTKKIEFDSNSLAQRYWPLGKNRAIVVDPHHQFGQPTIRDTNLLAETIFLLYTGGEKIKFIMNLFNIDRKSVLDSVKLYTRAA